LGFASVYSLFGVAWWYERSFAFHFLTQAEKLLCVDGAHGWGLASHFSLQLLLNLMISSAGDEPKGARNDIRVFRVQRTTFSS